VIILRAAVGGELLLLRIMVQGRTVGPPREAVFIGIALAPATHLHSSVDVSEGDCQAPAESRASGRAMVRGRVREMTQRIRNVMTANPIMVAATSSVAEAARGMRDANIGDVIVLDDGRIYGILTDRDIVVRAVAEGRDLATTKVADICSQALTTVSPMDSIEDAVRLIRDNAIRRLPVVEGGKPVGIVSIGDLAVSQDPHSALGHVSAAPPDR
jgi:CBS domain-containing protein